MHRSRRYLFCPRSPLGLVVGLCAMVACQAGQALGTQPGVVGAGGSGAAQAPDAQAPAGSTDANADADVDLDTDEKGPSPAPVVAPGNANETPAPGPVSPSASPNLHKLCAAAKGRLVAVQSAQGLRTAFAEAMPGDVIALADGIYSGSFVLAAQGTPEAPITVCGSGKAVLMGPSLTAGMTLHLNGAQYCQLAGLEVTGGAKGVMLDQAQSNLLQDLVVHDIGSEGIHFRKNSSNNVADGCSVFNTGKANNPMYGEGIYIGSSQNNWCSLTGGAADQSNNNVVQNCTVKSSTAEAIDIKEGTQGGIIRNNTLGGQGILASAATSVVNVKGNGYMLQNNAIEAAPEDAFSVHVILAGWGACNTFAGNSSTDGFSGYGVHLAAPKPWPAVVVKSDNAFAGAASGVSNTPLDGAVPDPSVCRSSFMSVSCAN